MTWWHRASVGAPVAWIGAAACCLLAAAACGPQVAQPDDTLPPIPSVAPASPTVAPTTGAPPPTAAAADVSALVASFDTDGDCRLGAVPVGGSITFTVGDRLLQSDTTGKVGCLADIGRDATWLRWSPDGDDVLVRPSLLLRSDGRLSETGFFEDNLSVRWSAPNGAALIARKSSTGELIWRDSADSSKRIALSFARSISIATYHPAGTHVVVAGEPRQDDGGSGSEALIVATNRGESPTVVGDPDHSTNVVELTTDLTGDVLFYTHSHKDGRAHLHRYQLSTQQTTTLVDGATLPDNVVASTVEIGDVAWTVPSSPSNVATMVFAAGFAEPLAVQPEPDVVSWPIGWLPGHRLLIGTRVAGASSDSPFDLWLWSTSSLQLVARDVDTAAARTVGGKPTPVPPMFGVGLPE
jgi:hypothetical protein